MGSEAGLVITFLLLLMVMMVVMVMVMMVVVVVMVVVMLMTMMMVIPWQNSSSVTVTDCQNTKTYVEMSFSSQPSLVGHEKNLIGCLSLERAWGHILGQAWK